MSETITITSIEWPKPGKKQGAVIDTNGKRWGVWDDKLTGYQRGYTYDITYESREFKGQWYNTIKTATPAGANSGAPKPAPPWVDKTSQPYSPPSDDLRRRDIYVCGAVNNMLSNPNVQPLALSAMQIAELTRKAIDAWKLTLGPKPDPISSTSNDDMNDSLPDFA